LLFIYPPLYYSIVRILLLYIGLFIVAFGFAVFPLYLKHRHADNNLTRKATPLSGGTITRGAYMNYGSKDVGPDPDYDLITGRYKGKSGEFHPTPEQVAEHRAILEKVLKAKGLAVPNNPKKELEK